MRGGDDGLHAWPTSMNCEISIILRDCSRCARYTCSWPSFLFFRDFLYWEEIVCSTLDRMLNYVYWLSIDESRCQSVMNTEKHSSVIYSFYLMNTPYRVHMLNIFDVIKHVFVTSLQISKRKNGVIIFP